MSRVVAFPAAYPGGSNDLESAESLLLGGFRGWVMDCKVKIDPMARLYVCMDTAGVYDAAYWLDRFMEGLARSASRPIEVYHPHCPCLSGDERSLMHVTWLAQARERIRAERVLQSFLASLGAVDAAMGHLANVGSIFAATGLPLPRRREPSKSMEIVQPWLPERGMLH